MIVKALNEERLALPLELQIRPCEERHLPLLEWDGLFTEHRQIFSSVFRRQKRGEVEMLVAEVNHYPIGQIWINFQREQDSGAAYLWAFRVMAPFQRLGIGSHLIAHAEDIARRKGFDRARLAVEKWNLSAFQFYRHRGYEPLGEVSERVRYRSPDGRRRSRTLKEFLLEKALVDSIDGGCLRFPGTPSFQDLNALNLDLPEKTGI